MATMTLLADRFWKKVTKTETCWIWTARSNSKGYGRIKISVDGVWKQRTAHRLSWEMHFGLIPEGKWVLHRCDNPLCVRPDHLFLGTAADNVADKMSKGRHRHLPKGYKFPLGTHPGRPKGIKSKRTPGVAIGRPVGSKLSPESLQSFRAKRGWND